MIPEAVRYQVSLPSHDTELVNTANSRATCSSDWSVVTLYHVYNFAFTFITVPTCVMLRNCFDRLLTVIASCFYSNYM